MRLLHGMDAHIPIGVPVQFLDSLVLIKLPSYQCAKEAVDGDLGFGSLRKGDLDRVSDSWFQPDLALAVTGIYVSKPAVGRSVSFYLCHSAISNK